MTHMIHFDFTFDCPIYLFSNGRGFLLTEAGDLCLWTDADAASTFVERSRGRHPWMGDMSLVEIGTDEELLGLLTGVQRDGIAEVVVDLANADQITARLLYTADLIDLLHEAQVDG
jgi:hypothetical protein